MDRTINVGSISAEQAISYGFTGPNLRAAGVDYDVRIAQPYSSYDDFDFIIPVGTSGDTYDRFCVRNAEVWQRYNSSSFGKKCLKEMNFMLTFLTITYLKRRCLHSMESLIYHFKIVMGEILFQLQKYTM
jgi:NADH-quinone oxidoreductase subunit D